MNGQCRPGRRAFTLMEVAIAIVIIGLGVTSTMMMSGFCVRQQSQADQQTMALYIAQNTLEAFKGAAYANLKALDGQTFTFGGTTTVTLADKTVVPVPCQSGYRQILKSEYMNANQLCTAAASQATDTGVVRLTVTVEKSVGAAWRSIYSQSSYAFGG